MTPLWQELQSVLDAMETGDFSPNQRRVVEQAIDVLRLLETAPGQ